MFKTQYNNDKKHFNTFVDDIFNKVYKKYKPFSKNKDRNFDYSSLPAGTDEQKSRLLDIYKTINVNADTETFDGKAKFN